MIAKNIYYHVEISFWNLVIPMMTNSPQFRRIFRSVMLFFRDHRELLWAPTLVFAFAGLGLLAGFVIGRVNAGLW
jgi:hypothetical protein